MDATLRIGEGNPISGLPHHPQHTKTKNMIPTNTKKYPKSIPMVQGLTLYPQHNAETRQ